MRFICFNAEDFIIVDGRISIYMYEGDLPFVRFCHRGDSCLDSSTICCTEFVFALSLAAPKSPWRLNHGRANLEGTKKPFMHAIPNVITVAIAQSMEDNWTS